MSVVKIFNPVKKVEIVIDSTSLIHFHPHVYEETPYFEIKIGGGFNFFNHAHACIDCKEFMSDFMSDSLDWYLNFSNVTYRLDLQSLGEKDFPKSNTISYTVSNYEFGTTLKLFFSDIPTEKDKLLALQLDFVAQENYEKACIIRDLINQNN